MAAQYIPIKRISSLDTPIKAEKLDGSLFTTENQAHEFIVSVRKNGVKQTVTGSVSGKFIRANGTTIFLQGSIVDGDAVVRLHQDCYNVQGRFTFNIFNTQSGVTTCIYSAVGKIDMGSTETVIDAGDVVPDLSDVVAKQEEMTQVISDARAATSAASQAATEGENKFVRFDASQTLTEAQKSTARTNIDSPSNAEITELKSAFLNTENTVGSFIANIFLDGTWENPYNENYVRWNGVLNPDGLSMNNIYVDTNIVIPSGFHLVYRIGQRTGDRSETIHAYSQNAFISLVGTYDEITIAVALYDGANFQPLRTTDMADKYIRLFFVPDWLTRTFDKTINGVNLQNAVRVLTNDCKYNLIWNIGGVFGSDGTDNNTYKYAIRQDTYISDLQTTITIDPSKVRIQIYYYTQNGTGYIERQNYINDSVTTRFDIADIAPVNTQYFRIAIWRVVNGSYDESTAIIKTDIPDILENISIVNICIPSDAPDTKNVHNIIDYGAIGDGVTDNYNAIQNALNDCRGNGGTVYFPSGTYVTTKQLVIYSNTILSFEKGAVVLRGDNINCIFKSYCTANTVQYEGVHDVLIENGTFDLGTGFTQGGAAFAFIHAQNVTFSNCTFMHNNSGYHFTDMCGCKNVHFYNCLFKDSLTINNYAEFIQFDAPYSRTQYPYDVNSIAEGEPCYDNTPCELFEISGCVFYLNAYSPAIGNHSSAQHRLIDFHDNYIYGGTGTRGAISFNNYQSPNTTTDVMIHHNVIESCTYGFNFDPDGTGKIYVRDNIFKNIETLQKNTSPVGQFLNNIES